MGVAIAAATVLPLHTYCLWLPPRGLICVGAAVFCRDTANDKIPFEYFLAGFSRFKAMAGGHGAISLSAETEMKLHHIAHVAENHVIDQRFEQMQAMKVEAHSIVMSEAPTLAYEPDTLSIRGPNNFLHHTQHAYQHIAMWRSLRQRS